MNKTRLLFVALFLVSFIPLFGQDDSPKPYTVGFETSIESEVLGESRPLLIYLPDNYEESENSYPVVYLMDGRGHFLHTVGAMQFLSRNQRMPQMIIVGIPNTGNRTRDLTPPETGEQNRFPSAGGADNMLQFMSDELQPFINANYRTTSFSTLIGHSFGGLFAIHSLVHHPQLFDAYLAISPSLWWNGQELVQQAEAYFSANPDQVAKLYMTMGNEGGDMLGGAWKLSAILKETNPEGIDWNFKLMEKESHGSVPYRSTYDGLEMLFKDWRVDNLYDHYKSGGLASIQKTFDQRRKIYGSGAAMASEEQINRLGYQLLNNREYASAITVFQENIQNHPQSANVYDSLAEALQKSGDKEGAIQNYKKSLALFKGNSNAIIQLEKLGVKYQADFKLSEEELETYTGKYQVAPGVILKITRDGSRLFGQPTGDTKKEMFATEKDLFVVDVAPLKVQFTRNDQDQINGVKVFIDGEVKMQGDRID